MPANPPRRRWFQFRLRTLLLAVTVLAVLTAWTTRSLKWIAARHTLLLEHAASHYDITNQPRVPAPGGLWLFGERGRAFVEVEPGHGLEAQQLFPEAKVKEATPASTSKH